MSFLYAGNTRRKPFKRNRILRIHNKGKRILRIHNRATSRKQNNKPKNTFIQNTYISPNKHKCKYMSKSVKWNSLRVNCFRLNGLFDLINCGVVAVSNQLSPPEPLLLLMVLVLLLLLLLMLVLKLLMILRKSPLHVLLLWLSPRLKARIRIHGPAACTDPWRISPSTIHRTLPISKSKKENPN